MVRILFSPFSGDLITILVPSIACAAQPDLPRVNVTAPLKRVYSTDVLRCASLSRRCALELIGLPLTMGQAVRSLAIQGRAALAGITEKTFDVAPYDELINREAEIIGVSDHRANEIPLLLDLARTGRLNFAGIITRTVPLDATAINATLDGLEQFSEDVRVVVNPHLGSG